MVVVVVVGVVVVVVMRLDRQYKCPPTNIQVYVAVILYSSLITHTLTSLAVISQYRKEGVANAEPLYRWPRRSTNMSSSWQLK